MDAQVYVLGGDAVTEYTMLGNWLGSERELAGRVKLVQRLPQEGEMGGVFEVLTVALGSGGAVVAMARSLVAWLQTRRSDIEITIASSEGATVRLTVHRTKTEDLKSLVQEVRAALPVPDDL